MIRFCLRCCGPIGFCDLIFDCPENLNPINRSAGKRMNGLDLDPKLFSLPDIRRRGDMEIKNVGQDFGKRYQPTRDGNVGGC